MVGDTELIKIKSAIFRAQKGPCGHMVGDTELLGGFYVPKKYMSIFQKNNNPSKFQFQKKGRPVLPPTPGFSNGFGHNSDAIRRFSAKLARLILKFRGASCCGRPKIC